MTQKSSNATYKLIYNPHAGEKKKTLTTGASLDDVKAILQQYKIAIDYAPTKSAGHALTLAQEASQEGYKTVLVAGGDGTVNQVAKGLIGTDITMGIIPMGTFMNIARMLSIPFDIEKAIELIKIGRKRSIDAGVITQLEGKKLSEPQYFFETVGLGLEAEIQKEFKRFEAGNYFSLIKMIHIYLRFYSNPLTITSDDDQTLTTKASLISIANGPYAGAGLQLAPDAKLNDHRLTITVYHMSKFELCKHFFRMKLTRKIDKKRLRTFQATKVSITARKPVALHADATIFSQTPATITIEPNAVQVICGFPKADEETGLVY